MGDRRHLTISNIAGQIYLKDRVSHTRLGLITDYVQQNKFCKFYFILFELFQFILFTQKIVPTILRQIRIILFTEFFVCFPFSFFVNNFGRKLFYVDLQNNILVGKTNSDYMLFDR